MAEFGPVEFWVDGHPKGQPRPRACIRGGHAAVYDAGTAEGWKGCVALAARPFLPPTPYAGPVWLRLCFAMPRPKSHYRKHKSIINNYTETILKPDAPTWHTGKPDSDNLAKAVLDVLTQIGMWVDDDQVCKLEVGKVYGEKPGCSVKIDTVGVVR